MEPSREHCRTGRNTGRGGKYRQVSSVIPRTQKGRESKSEMENSRGSNWIKEAPAFHHRSLSYSTSPHDPGRCLVNVENVPHLLSSPWRQFHLFNMQTDPLLELGHAMIRWDYSPRFVDPPFHFLFNLLAFLPSNIPLILSFPRKYIHLESRHRLGSN